MARFEQFAVCAAVEAVQQAGLERIETESHRASVLIGSAIGSMGTMFEQSVDYVERGPRRLSPFAIPMIMPNGAVDLLAIEYGFRGASFAPVSACASGADAIGYAYRFIREGWIDVSIVGGAEAIICPLAFGLFDRISALSRREDPAKTPRPFDRERDGFVMGEGAGILILESLARAKRRGAEILAEVTGFGATTDAHHVTAPDPEGRGAARAIRMALEDARIAPEDVDYINAHGTGTLLNDEGETRAIKLAFGPAAYEVPISSTKSMTGHAMGATGAMEAIFCIEAMRKGIIPPTINLENPDPACDLDYTPQVARPQPVRVAMNNANGLGGHNAILIFRKFE
jgi:beta-ketoacyl-acyl-carrier-protein synthase II